MLGLAFTRSFWPFFLLMLVHCLLYVPTISITNSIAFAHMKDPQKEFGIVRMGGTIGWILAAWPFTFILVDWDKVHAANPQGFVELARHGAGSGLTGPGARKRGTTWTFIVAGIASLVLAAFSLTLPHTPPKPAEAGANEARVARGDAAAAHPVHSGALARDASSMRRAQPATSTGPGAFSAQRPAAGRHPRQLDHAGDEHRPDRGDPDDADPGRDARSASAGARR